MDYTWLFNPASKFLGTRRAFVSGNDIYYFYYVVDNFSKLYLTGYTEYTD